MSYSQNKRSHYEFPNYLNIIQAYSTWEENDIIVLCVAMS